MKQSLVYIALVVNDYDEAIYFYTQKLHFELLEDTVLSDTKRWVIVAPKGDNGCSLLLAKAASDEQKIRVGNQTGGRVFLFLHTDDFERDYRNLLAQNITIVREPSVENYGTVAVFTDLYGNLWDLIQPIKQRKHEALAKNNTPSGDGGVETFTVGNDREFDLLLAPFDILGNIAHAKMLATVGLLKADEAALLTDELKEIYKTTQPLSSSPSGDGGTFTIDNNIEDIHSQIEFLLTQKLGDVGKKIHSARSRNDQVLVDVKLFLRSEIEKIVLSIQSFFRLLINKSNELKNDLLPGYTHLQLAMPSSFGLWLGAYAEGFADDIIILKSAYDVVNKNPLGSAAGYGSSFPINRTLTTKLLGFADLHYNVVYAQMSRGKTERIVASALANIADTLAKLSMDATLYLNQNFGFISFPPQLTTGSSIMPHKKNPDVFELIRAQCNRIKALPNEIMMMTTNLPSGYHRDLQLLKEHLFPSFQTLRNSIEMASLMIANMQVKKDILEDEKYKYLFSVEEVNKLVLQGVPFRDAYKKIGLDIEENKFTYSTQINHTHEGSIGNLCNDKIEAAMQKTIGSFHFEDYHAAIESLLVE